MGDDFFFYGFFALVALISGTVFWIAIVRPRTVPPAAGPAAPVPPVVAAPTATTSTAEKHWWLAPFVAIMEIGLVATICFIWFDQLVTLAEDEPRTLIFGSVLALIFSFGLFRWALMKHSDVTAYLVVAVAAVLCVVALLYFGMRYLLGPELTNNLIAGAQTEIIDSVSEMVETERLPNGEDRHTLNLDEINLWERQNEREEVREALPAVDPLCKDAVTGQALGDCEVFQLRTGQSITRVAKLRHCLGYFPAEGVMVTPTGHDQYNFTAAGESETRFAVYSIPVGQTANGFFCPPG